MNTYTSFAEVYDTFMDNVPYEEWVNYLLSLLRENGIEEGLIYDLGCGTGSVTERLYDAGFSVIGVDNSVEMLNIALRKKGEKDILYVNQDMRELNLLHKAKAVVSLCDSLNYILGEDELLRVFQGVFSHLEEEGVFIFDMNTVYKYRELLGESTIAENRDDMSFIWENFYDEEERVNEYDLTLYIKSRTEPCFFRFEEVHYQMAYEALEVEELLKEAGFSSVSVFDAFSKKPPHEESERLYFVAKK